MKPRAAPVKLSRTRLLSTYRRLYAHYGPQHWWPGDTPFEIMVGAVLTQNTAWLNVERAIANLKQAQCLDAQTIAAMAPDALALLLRPAGYFNVKTRRLQALCRWLLEIGGIDALRGFSTETLRPALLDVHGIGPETCDDILLYACARPVFVIDAYTCRLGARLGFYRGDEGYEALRAGFERALPHDTTLFNDYHALIVRHAKLSCTTKPRCDTCCLKMQCPSAAA